MHSSRDNQEVYMAERDPVCGMMVDPKDALSIDHGSHTHYFCSAACRDQFQADPSRYHDKHASGGREGMEQHEPPRTTTPFAAPKFGSAGSGGAEFEQLPEAHRDKQP
jgi:YHS domain-containing protein